MGPRAITLVLLLVVAGCGGGADDDRSAATAAREPPSQRLALQTAGSVDEAPLGYLEYLPPGYDDGTTRPLLVFLHGSDENGDGSKAALRKLFKHGPPRLIEDREWPENRPFIVLAPQYGFAEAQECRLAEQIESFLAFAIDHYAVDASRVYLTGISCGALGIWDYLAAHHDDTVIAAAVPIAGLADHAFGTAGCELGRVPIWAFHGDADTIVPKRYIVEPINDLKACTNPSPLEVRLTIYPNVGHDAWTRTYRGSAGRDIYAWFLTHRRAS